MFSDELDVVADYTICLASSRVIEDDFAYCNGTVFWNSDDIIVDCVDIEDGNNELGNYLDDETNWKKFCKFYGIAEDDEIEDILTIR